MPSPSTPKLGLVLPAGGARAAYQVGVLRYLAENFPEFRPRIFSGVSAGSINSCFLAQGEPFHQAAINLYALWEKLTISQVLRMNFGSAFAMGTRWVSDLFLSKLTQRLVLRSLLDSAPLSQTLLSNIHFWKIARAVRSGTIDGVSVSATNYHDGTTTIFYDSFHPISPWRREQRRGVRMSIRLRHVLASCSIPLLFEPVRVGDYFFGDGSLRFSYPLSPPIHMGASHVFAIGIRCPEPENPLGVRPDHVGMGFVAGAVLNAIFLDSLESDFENLCRLNLVRDSELIRPVSPYLIRPSRDLGAIARNFIDEVPFHWRQIIRSTGSPNELGDLLSYLMFSPGFVRALLELGRKDAETHHQAISEYLRELRDRP